MNRLREITTGLSLLSESVQKEIILTANTLRDLPKSEEALQKKYNRPDATYERIKDTILEAGLKRVEQAFLSGLSLSSLRKIAEATGMRTKGLSKNVIVERLSFREVRKPAADTTTISKAAPDVWLHIVSNLEHSDIIALCEVSEEAMEFCNDQEVWKHIVRNKYPHLVTIINNIQKEAPDWEIGDWERLHANIWRLKTSIHRIQVRPLQAVFAFGGAVQSEVSINAALEVEKYLVDPDCDLSLVLSVAKEEIDAIVRQDVIDRSASDFFTIFLWAQSHKGLMSPVSVSGFWPTFMKSIYYDFTAFAFAYESLEDPYNYEGEDGFSNEVLYHIMKAYVNDAVSGDMPDIPVRKVREVLKTLLPVGISALRNNTRVLMAGIVLGEGKYIVDTYNLDYQDIVNSSIDYMIHEGLGSVGYSFIHLIQRLVGDKVLSVDDAKFALEGAIENAIAQGLEMQPFGSMREPFINLADSEFSQLAKILSFTEDDKQYYDNLFANYSKKKILWV